MMETKICVVGLGYVGLPLAVEFDNHFQVIGFDVNGERVKQLASCFDNSGEVEEERLKVSKILFTDDPERIRESNFIVVCVPTPVDKAKKPDLSFLKSASEIIGKNLSKDSVVVYESTVYPGCTEEVCVPVLEKFSGLKCGEDFKIGYSPERINPGDKEHTINKVVKIVSGNDGEALSRVASVYSKVVGAGVHEASSIKVAEAAKIIENVQRDLNIALMNELAIIFDKIGINTREVLEAAGTKWNFHKYYPGLVGGHCIGVDPYYLTHKVLELGYNPEVILAGRRINDLMYKHLVDLVIRGLSDSGKILNGSKVALLGLSFKENVKDYRNSKALDVAAGLKSYNISVFGCDPLLGKEIVEREFGVSYLGVSELGGLDGLVIVSPHKEFGRIDLKELVKEMNDRPFIIDLKGFFDENEVLASGFSYQTF